MLRGSRKKRPSALDNNDSRPSYLNRSPNRTKSSTGGPGGEVRKVASGDEEELRFAIRSMKKQLDETRKRETAMTTRSEQLQKLLLEKDSMIAELRKEKDSQKASFAAQSDVESQKKVSEVEKGFKESLDNAETKLRVKTAENSKLTSELVELRNALTQMAKAMQKMEDERNFNKAKVTELTKSMNSGEGKVQTDTEKSLALRTAQVQELSALVDTLSRNLHEKDDKILEIEQEHSVNHSLLKQLNNMFPDATPVSLDERLSTQNQSVILMNMMNMLNELQAKSEQVQRERDASLRKTADLSIIVAERSAQIDQLNARLRKLEAKQGGQQSFVAGRLFSRNSDVGTHPTVNVQKTVDNGSGYSGYGSSAKSYRATRIMKYLKTNLTPEVDEHTESLSHSSGSGPYY